jgi:hypothetical protein
MRKALGVICYILAGFFVYMVCLLAFVNQPTIAKWGIVAGFSLPALVFLSIGLSVNGFQRWRRDTGVVLLSGAGFTSFVIFTFVCFIMTEEFEQMMQPDTLAFFNAYISGGIFILSVVTLGIVLLKTEKKTAEGSAHNSEGCAPSV